MGPSRPHLSSLSSIEVGFSLCLSSKLLLPFSMPRAAENHPLSKGISAALRGIHDVGQTTGHSTSTSSSWLASAYGGASIVASCDHLLPRRAHSVLQGPSRLDPTKSSMSLVGSRLTLSLSPQSRLVFQEGLRPSLSLPLSTAWRRCSKLCSMHRWSLKVVCSRTDQSPILEVIINPPAPRLNVNSLP